MTGKDSFLVSLVMRHLDGDSAASEQLAGEIVPVVVSCSRRYILSGHSREDVVAEGLAKAFTALERFEPGRGDVKGFVRQSVSNHLKTRARILRRRHRVWASSDETEEEALVSPVTVIYRAEVDDALTKMVLSAEEIAGEHPSLVRPFGGKAGSTFIATVFVANYLSATGMTRTEVAGALGVPKSWVSEAVYVFRKTASGR